ncbi:hypothetical protein [Acinetobacter nosocomialis]|uniref:hypothetical protein n=1 Tax=Acinetobacter nosocomialis TaxID=106654 RepID=UPI001B81EB1D|nr:hypothetical protein [Acinetobacter nosocomialis]MBR7681749.1 hypothetical protein [Acinetobacter nosocomialis]
MNMLANISFDAAVFTSLEATNVEVINDEIYFSLICPGKEHIYVVGKCSGIEKESSFEWDEGNPQYAKDVNFTMLQVTEFSRPHVEDFDYVDAIEGMPFALTSTQIQKLNEYLEELAKEEKIKELRGG